MDSIKGYNNNNKYIQQIIAFYECDLSKWFYNDEITFIIFRTLPQIRVKSTMSQLKEVMTLWSCRKDENKIVKTLTKI